jgi:hypothetical protein
MPVREFIYTRTTVCVSIFEQCGLCNEQLEVLTDRKLLLKGQPSNNNNNNNQVNRTLNVFRTLLVVGISTNRLKRYRKPHHLAFAKSNNYKIRLFLQIFSLTRLRKFDLKFLKLLLLLFLYVYSMANRIHSMVKTFVVRFHV